ncbi:transglycosylase domain-containing protein [Candidatus Woesebacteria bacterium]|nr:transglycosylase domain-containing protein [Candidatus Woesebacteria bacterium]
MRGEIYKRSDDYPVLKIASVVLAFLVNVVTYVGKPLYFLLLISLLILTSISYLVGYSTRQLSFLIVKLLKNYKSFLKFLLTLMILVLFGTGFLLWKFILQDLPSPNELSTRNLDVSTKIYDRNGVLLYKIYKDQNRTPVVLADIPLHVRLATLAAEDAEFYNHPGFSVRGITRAIYRNLTRGEISGGSTITQQLTKNALLTPDKTIIRKLKEIVLSIKVERAFSKDQILEMYLNEVSYGGTAYGIQEAAKVHFDKDAHELTLSEAAYLAGLPRSPTKFSPFGPTPKLGLARQKDILNLMVINKFITREEALKTIDEPLKFATQRLDMKAPHFVMFVREYLVDKYGEDLVEKGGLEVTTTLDYNIQKFTEEVVRKEIEKLKKLNVGNGAALVINPSNGEILTMVGSYDYFDLANDGNVNVATSLRQPGSSIKIINYAYALSNGFNPATLLSDTPVTYKTYGSPPYTPRNYDGNYRGKITLRQALAESRNIPAVKVLASYGVTKMIEMGRMMGITTWNDPKNYGLSLTLGGGDIKLIDLARAYATIANYGKLPELIPVLKIKNYKDKVLEEGKCKPSRFTLRSSCEQPQVIDPRVAFLLTDILRDNKARAPAFGLNSALVIPKHEEVAVKTGTSNNLRDNLTIGFNQKYLVAVWVGNNDNTPMARIASGITGAAPIFNKIMGALLANESNHPWEMPSGLVQVPICTVTGTLGCAGCPSIQNEWFLEENKPTKTCRPEWFQPTLEPDNLDFI